MNNALTVREKVETAVRSINRWIGLGMCYRCALIATSELLSVDRDKLEQVWLDYEAEKMNDEIRSSADPEELRQ
jgi:hypothetical protein